MPSEYWSKCNYGKCYGSWAETASECSKCSVSENCKKMTIKMMNDSSKNEESGELSVLDYLLQRLSGSFEKTTEKNGDVVAYRFFKNGKLAMAVVDNGVSTIKLVSLIRNRERVLEKTTATIAEAEEALKDML